jgi:hypothetical protein
MQSVREISYKLYPLVENIVWKLGKPYRYIRARLTGHFLLCHDRCHALNWLEHLVGYRIEETLTDRQIVAYINKLFLDGWEGFVQRDQYHPWFTQEFTEEV